MYVRRFSRKIFPEISGRKFQTFHCSNFITMKRLKLSPRHLRKDFFLIIGVHWAKVYIIYQKRPQHNIEVSNFIHARLRIWILTNHWWQLGITSFCCCREDYWVCILITSTIIIIFNIMVIAHLIMCIPSLPAVEGLPPEPLTVETPPGITVIASTRQVCDPQGVPIQVALIADPIPCKVQPVLQPKSKKWI